jgi:hypothetical protein
MSLEHLQEEQLWHKMATAERLLVSKCFITYYYHHLLASHPTKLNMYTALQNENAVSYIIIIVNKRQLTMSSDRRNCKQHCLQAGILKNCDELCKMIL